MRSRVAEVFTYPPDAGTAEALRARRDCLCRFRGSGLACEQQNNRGQVALVNLERYPDLRERYGRPTIPLGVCSVLDKDTPWVVCPTRLFYTGPARPILEHSIYHAWGLRPGDHMAMWREVRVQSRRRAKKFNYNFDYVFRELIGDAPPTYSDTPFVIEVMSCSTSGGGVSQEFARALGSNWAQERRGRLSLNKRQVLGRMMSQLVAKAETVHAWGGKTTWIVQDVFWNYINETTGFNMDEFREEPEGNMLMVVRHLETVGYEAADPENDSYRLRHERTLRGWDRSERSRGDNTVGRDFVSLLNAPFVPERDLLLRKTNRREPTAIVTCAT